MRTIFPLLVSLAICAGSVAAQSWQPPSEQQRCPSKWGASDERAAANHMKPASVLKATSLIKTGEVIELSHVLSDKMPLSAGRRFEMVTKRTDSNIGTNRRGSNEELIIAEMGQVGTQFDGFAHQAIGDKLYNCIKLDDAATRTGFKKLGIENVGMLMTRGVMIDIAAYKGVDMLAPGYEITVQDLQQALARQKQKIEPGDAVIIHTGFGKLWEKDNAKYGSRTPGIGAPAAEWIAKQDPMLVGSDVMAVEVNPNPDAKISLPVHQIMLVVYGIHLLEHLKLDELAAKRVYEFALVVQPLKLKGATGSTVAPVAIR